MSEGIEQAKIMLFIDYDFFRTIHYHCFLINETMTMIEYIDKVTEWLLQMGLSESISLLLLRVGVILVMPALWPDRWSCMFCCLSVCQTMRLRIS